MVIIEVVYATKDQQTIVQLTLPQGSSARDAVVQSGLAEKFNDIDPVKTPLGIYGRPVDENAALSDGDRVEIYRPLIVDPMQARRLRAEAQAKLKDSVK